MVPHLREKTPAGFGRFGQQSGGAPLQHFQHGGGHAVPQGEAADDFQTVGEGGLVRSGGAGADDIQIVPQHVGDDERDHRGRGQRLGQMAALDPGEVLADGVYLVDVRPAVQQQAGGPHFVLQRHGRPGAGDEGAGPAGQEKEDQIVFTGCGRAFKERPGRGLTRAVRYGMGRFQHVDAVQRQAVSVFGDHEPSGQGRAEQVAQGLGHGCRGFSRAEGGHAPEPGQIVIMPGHTQDCTGETEGGTHGRSHGTGGKGAFSYMQKRRRGHGNPPEWPAAGKTVHREVPSGGTFRQSGQKLVEAFVFGLA